MNTPERKPPFRQPNLSGRNIVGSTSTQGETTRGASLGILVKDIHHPEVVVHHAGWQDMIPPSGYQNSREMHLRTLRSTCSSVKRSGKQSRS
jgi:hypothetical protein